MILIDGRDADRAGNHHVGLAARFAHLVNALARGEGFEFDLAGQDRGFVCVEQREQGNVLQDLRVASHRIPRGFCWLSPDADRASVVYRAKGQVCIHEV